MFFEETCECRCHDERQGLHVSHCMPCCYKCPHCHGRICTSSWSRHATACEDRYNPVVGDGVRLNAVIDAIKLLQKAGLNTASTNMHLTELLSVLGQDRYNPVSRGDRGEDDK
jgi:hypothetical protein